MSGPNTEPTRRDGHLSDLDLELLFAEPSEHPGLSAHCADCDSCRARLAAVRDEEDAFRQRVMPSVLVAAHQVPQPANRPVVWAVVTTLIALAAAVLLVLRLGPTTVDPLDDFTTKGGAIDLEVFIHDGDSVRPADHEVHPGDRLGFRVTPREDGYLMVIGFDATGPYPCWPSDSAAVFVRAEGVALDLDAAIRLDERLGTERIVAVLCEHPVNYSDVRMAVEQGGAEGGCVSDEVELVKTASPVEAP